MIARLPREPGGIGVATRWVGGGDAGLTLRAPSGMAFAGDTLWVADERVLRGFDRKTGRSVTSVDLGPVGAVSLGDVASGPDGSLYVTDADRQLGEPGKPGLGEYGRIYRVFPSGRASSALLSGRIASPTWMAWDARAKRFVLAPSVGDTLFAWRPGQRRPQPLVAGPGRYRGVAATPEGRVFVASEATGGLYELRDGRLEEVLPGLRGVTDLAYDPVHRWLAVPMRDAGRVAFYAAPPAGAGRGRR